TGRAGDAVAQMADEQDIEIGIIVVLEHEVVLRREEGGPVAALRHEERRFFNEIDLAQLLSPYRRDAIPEPFAHRQLEAGLRLAAIDIVRNAHLMCPAAAALPTLVGELLAGRRERIRNRIPDVALAVPVEIDRVLVVVG